MRTIKFTPKFLLDALQGKAASFANNLPADAQLLDLRFDLCSNQILAVIRSDSFEDIAELYPIPEFKLTYTTTTPTTKTVTQPTATAKTETKPTTTTKPEPKTTTKTQPNTTTNKIENEFSPEQRKLLSFTVKEDCVVVKPVMFLKAEWDDINEVVRSLGGKWVKGAIISYWEIPMH